MEFVFHNKMYTKKCISEGARGIIFSLVSFNALGSKCMETTVKSVANSFQELFHSRHYVATELLDFKLDLIPWLGGLK